MGFDRLIGKRINKILMNDAKDVIVFETNDSKLAFTAHGDCCSHSFFVHMDGVKALLGQVVNDTREVSLPEVVSDDEYIDIKVYGYTFTTPKGRSTLEMRNESNGYYSGYLVFEDDEVDTSKFKDITDDID